MKFLFPLFWLISFGLSAQNRFSRLYDYNDNDLQTAFTLLEQTDGGFLAGMKNLGAEYSDNKILLFRLDNKGDINWINEIYKEGFIYYLNFGSMLILPDGNYLIGGEIKELATELSDIFLVKTDTLGNVIWSKTYGTTDKNDFFGNFALMSNNANVMVCGQTRKTDPAGNIWILRIDIDGQLIWDVELPGAGWQHGEFMAMMPNGHFLLAAQFGSASLYQYMVYKINGAGQVLWQRKVGTQYNDSGYPKIIALPDGSGIFTGAVGTTNWQVHIAYAVKLSPNGDIVWEKTYPGSFFTSSAFPKPVLLDDGAVILSGGVREQQGDPISWRYWKINPDGEMLWEHIHFFNPDDNNYIYHQIGTADGGIAGVGFSYKPGETFQDAWVLKLDSEGCLIENCTVSADAPQGEAEQTGDLVFYPNPAAATVTVRYSPDTPDGRAMFTLTDLFGRQVLTAPVPHSEFQLDLGNIPTGAYFGTITVDGKRLATGKLILMQ